MLLLCLLEILYIKYKEKQEVPWREIIFNLNSGHVILWLFRGVEVVCFDLVARHFSMGLIGKLPVVLQWIFAFFAWDFCFYWMHRLHHKYKILWAVHVVHHEGEHFNFSLGIRNSWYSSLTSFPFFAGLAILGVSTEQFYLIGGLHYFIQFYNHNSIIKNHGFLDRFVISPSHHKIHHAINKEYRDKNCGGTLTIWDKWFGTYQKEKEGVKIQLGVTSSTHSIDNPITANNFHLIKYIFSKKRQQNDNIPKATNSQYDFIVSLGGFILFGLLMIYIYYENKWSNELLMQLFSLLVFATIIIYGVFENYFWAKILWLFFGLFLLCFVLFNQIINIYLFILVGLFILHSGLVFYVSRSLKKA